MVTSKSTLPYAPLVEGTRALAGGSTHIEIFHCGVICISAGNGTPIATVGDGQVTSPLRSTAKAFQLLPFIFDGLHKALPQGRTADLNGVRNRNSGLADIAVMMSSHNGETMHTERIAELLRSGGLTPAALGCGTHPPLHDESHATLIRRHQKPSPLHCNCSGKHTNMLLVCKAHQWPMESYLRMEHPLQQRISSIISILANKQHPLPHVIDGCSLPTLILSIAELAQLYGHLAYPQMAPQIEEQNPTEALQLLFHAGVTYPEMVAGTGRLDTSLMRAFEGRVFAKTGAAGVYAMAVKPSERHPTGLAIAIKVSDGDTTSSIRRVVAVEVLKQLGLTTKTQADQLDMLAARHLTNFRNTTVGELRTLFKLTV